MTDSAAGRAALLGLGLLLLWRILFVNAIAYGEGNVPELGVPAEGEGRVPALQAEIAANPASPWALVQLGLERDRAGDAATAARAFAAALRLAPIDPDALRSAAALDVRERRLDDAVRRIDRLLAYYGETREWAFPLLIEWLAIPQARAALESLAREPSAWMGSFLAHACGRADPPSAAALLSRRAVAGLAGREELRCGLDALRRAGHWDAAYQLWLNTLPRERLAEVGYVFNGGFEEAPSGLGFDWVVDERSPAQSVDFPMGSGGVGRRALRVAWTGKRIAGPAIRQHLALRPGRYELTGLARLDGLQSVRGVQWVVRCAAEPRASLGASERFLGSGEWRRFAFGVEIPRQCPGQVLQLEPAGLGEGTTYVEGRAWFDDLRLARAD